MVFGDTSEDVDEVISPRFLFVSRRKVWTNDCNCKRNGMTNQHIHAKVRVTAELFLGVMMLACGCCIYLLFRSKSLNLYQWCSVLGLSDSIDFMRHAVQDWNLPHVVRYSLPDGLYCAAYLMMVDAVWYKEKGLVKYFVLSIVPAITITSEVLQYWGLLKGTFDAFDLVFYLIPLLVYLIVHWIHTGSVHERKLT